VQEQEVDDMAVPDAVDQIAERAAGDQREGGGAEAAALGRATPHIKHDPRHD
jgi:hypothetical protein